MRITKAIHAGCERSAHHRGATFEVRLGRGRELLGVDMVIFPGDPAAAAVRSAEAGRNASRSWCGRFTRGSDYRARQCAGGVPATRYERNCRSSWIRGKMTMSTAEKLSPTTQSDFESRASMVRARRSRVDGLGDLIPRRSAPLGKHGVSR